MSGRSDKETLVPYRTSQYRSWRVPSRSDCLNARGLASRNRTSPALAASVSARPRSLSKPPQSVLQLGSKVSVDEWLALGVTADGLRSRLLGLFDAEDVVQELVGVGCACVLRDKQQDAPVGCLEDSQQPPFSVEAQSADG